MRITPSMTFTAVVCCILAAVQACADAGVLDTWVPSKEGVEYRIRQEQAAWRVNEIPLLYLDLRNRGTRRDLCVELHQSQQRLVVRNQEYKKVQPWGGVERLEPQGDYLTIPFTLCDWTTRQDSVQTLELGLGKHQLQFKIHIASYAPKGAADEDRGNPFDFVTDAIEIEFGRVGAEDNATQTLLENIRRELIAFPRFHTPVVSPTLNRMVRENLPRSSAFLIDLVESREQSLQWPAAVTFAKHWDSIPHKQIEQYLKVSLTDTVALREVYPQGVEAAIQLGYWFRPGYLGMPADKNYCIETTTTHYLDNSEYGEPFSYSGSGATTGWIHTKNLPEGPHHVHLVTEYRFSRENFTCSDRVESGRYDFEIGPSDMDDDLLTPHDADVDRLVRESFRIAETDEDLEPRHPFRRIGRPIGYYAIDPWQAQIRLTSKDGPSSAFHMPVWKLTEELPVDLCFRVKIRLATAVVDGDELVVLKGEKGQSYFSPRNPHAYQAIMNHQDEQGQVRARIVLTPSRGVALSNTKVTNYYNGEIVSPPMRIFVDGAKPGWPNAPISRDVDDISWGRPVDGLAIGLISSRTRPLGSNVPELLAFFRNTGGEDQHIIRSAGYFGLELNDRFFGPLNLNGKSTRLTPGERLGPVTIEPVNLHEMRMLAPGEQPANDAGRARLKPGINTLRVIYWHKDKPVQSGEVKLTM